MFKSFFYYLLLSFFIYLFIHLPASHFWEVSSTWVCLLCCFLIKPRLAGLHLSVRLMPVDITENMGTAGCSKISKALCAQGYVAVHATLESPASQWQVKNPNNVKALSTPCKGLLTDTADTYDCNPSKCKFPTKVFIVHLLVKQTWWVCSVLLQLVHCKIFSFLSQHSDISFLVTEKARKLIDLKLFSNFPRFRLPITGSDSFPIIGWETSG